MKGSFIKAVRQVDWLQLSLIMMIYILVFLEKVDKFCYLGDMLDTVRGCDSAVMARVRCAWKKFL